MLRCISVTSVTDSLNYTKLKRTIYNLEFRMEGVYFYWSMQEGAVHRQRMYVSTSTTTVQRTEMQLDLEGIPCRRQPAESGTTASSSTAATIDGNQPVVVVIGTVGDGHLEVAAVWLAGRLHSRHDVVQRHRHHLVPTVWSSSSGLHSYDDVFRPHRQHLIAVV